MKWFLPMGALMLCSMSVLSQNKDVMEKRANAFVEALNSGNRETYRKFIIENYTKELINRKMSRKIVGDDASASSVATEDALADKLNMFDQLHQDLGKGKVSSIKQNGDKLDMLVTGDSGTSLNFGMTFLKDAPNLINAVSVQMTMNR